MENSRKVQPEIRAVFPCFVFDVEAKRIAVENARVFREKAKKHSDEKDFEVVSGVAGFFEFYVQVAEKLDSFEANRRFITVLILFVAGNKREKLNVFPKIFQLELVFHAMGFVEAREIAFFRLDVEKFKVFVIGKNNVARTFIFAPLVAERLDVVESLELRIVETFSERFVLDEQFALPEQVDETVVAGKFFHGFLKRSDRAATNPEDIEKVVPKRSVFGRFARFTFPFARKTDGAGTDFIHG